MLNYLDCLVMYMFGSGEPLPTIKPLNIQLILKIEN